MYSRKIKIFGTTLEVIIPKDGSFEEAPSEKVSEEVFSMFKKFDLIFSRFNKESELSVLNKERKAKVSPEFIELLKKALMFVEETNGVFNPLVNLSALGYSEDFHHNLFVKKGAETSLDIRNVLIDENENTVELKSTAQLDLGGCAKGFAVDKAVSLAEKSLNNFIINAGGDLYAKGLFHGKKWEVGIANPKNEEENLEIIKISNKAVATSGSYRRKWTLEGEQYHHILSGKDGRPTANNISCVTVVADSCLEADVYAKTAFILGESEGQEFLGRKNLTGYFVLLN